MSFHIFLRWNFGGGGPGEKSRSRVLEGARVGGICSVWGSRYEGETGVVVLINGMDGDAYCETIGRPLGRGGDE